LTAQTPIYARPIERERKTRLFLFVNASSRILISPKAEKRNGTSEAKWRDDEILRVYGKLHFFVSHSDFVGFLRTAYPQQN
jgi:hypothetical protein